MAMVVRANRVCPGIGGHISTFGSLSMLLDVGFNHFFRGPENGSSGDQVYFQGHASPGIYARAFLEGRLSEKQIFLPKMLRDSRTTTVAVSEECEGLILTN